MNNLKNVLSVSRISASELSGVIKSGSGSVTVPDTLVWENIPIQKPAKLSIINKVVDKQHTWQYELSFRSCSDLDVSGHYCYKIATADDRVWLLGSYDRPYPVTTCSTLLPDNLSESQLTEYSVSLVSAAPIMEIA